MGTWGILVTIKNYRGIFISCKICIHINFKFYTYIHIYIMFAHGRGERKEKTTEKNIGYFTKLGFWSFKKLQNGLNSQYGVQLIGNYGQGPDTCVQRVSKYLRVSENTIHGHSTGVKCHSSQYTSEHDSTNLYIPSWLLHRAMRVVFPLNIGWISHWVSISSSNSRTIDRRSPRTTEYGVIGNW